MLQNKLQAEVRSNDAVSLKGKGGLKRIILAMGYSMDGLLVASLEEAAFRQLLLLNIVLIPVACLLEITPAERAILIMVTVLTLIVELVNTGLEAAIDRISLDIHPLSKQAKDMGSAAQLLSLSLVIGVWMVICI
ncbi:MAG: diacylglycerol kinase [Porticoccus sp.]|nr:diacylglycerol kinase [Porticoccus sp.]